MLFTVDLMVALGLVEAWWLSTCAKGPTWYCSGLQMAEWVYRCAAGVLLVGTVYIAFVAVRYERLSIDLWKDYDAVERTRRPRFRIDRWWMRAAMLRWIMSWLHLLWIVRAPKLSLFS